jgi:subtilisin family serine protease
MKFYLLALVIVLNVSAFNISILKAQSKKYWIFLKDKQTTHYNYEQHLSRQTITNRTLVGLPLWQETDIPVSSTYLNTLQNEGIKIVAISKWLNAVTAVLDEKQYHQISKLPFVASLRPVNTAIQVTKTNFFESTQEISYGTAIAQMNLQAFEKAGLNGDGVTIGVIDAGFYGAHLSDELQDIEQRTLAQRDYLSPKNNLFKVSETSSDTHGATVLMMISGKSEKTQRGLAYKAKFYLARTDHGDKEYRGEEDLWIMAMEWMDSVGVRIINTSLGYALKHDDPKEDYSPLDMNGKTTVITKAAQIAADKKGMLLIVSAGNEGDEDTWGIISAPADAEGVLSVGATEENYAKASYSSIGPNFISYLKPNVSCFSRTGTSFSAPVITGFAACLMQKLPAASNKEIYALIEKSASLYPYGNNYIGYGIPNCATALALIDKKEPTSRPTFKQLKGKTEFALKIKGRGLKRGVVYHKLNERTVIEQVRLRGVKRKIIVKKVDNAKFSTVITDNGVTEIEW